MRLWWLLYENIFCNILDLAMIQFIQRHEIAWIELFSWGFENIKRKKSKFVFLVWWLFECYHLALVVVKSLKLLHQWHPLYGWIILWKFMKLAMSSGKTVINRLLFQLLLFSLLSWQLKRKFLFLKANGNLNRFHDYLAVCTKSFFNY